MTKPFDIPKALIWEAFQCVKANGGAAGVDRESIEQFESHLGDNLYKLWNRLCSGSYFPPPASSAAKVASLHTAARAAWASCSAARESPRACSQRPNR